MIIPEDPTLDQSDAIALAQARAKLLRAGVAQGVPQGQLIGNDKFQHYVAPHWSQQMAPLVKGVMASRLEDQALGMQRQQRLAQDAEAQRLIGSIPKDEEVTQELAGPTMDGEPLVGKTLKKATAADRAKWGMEAIRSRHPDMVKMGQKVVEDALTKDPDEAERNATRLLLGDKTIEGKRIAAEAQERASMYRDNARKEMNEQTIKAKLFMNGEDNRTRLYVSDNTLRGVLDRNSKNYDAAMAKVKASGGAKLGAKDEQQIQELLGGISRQETFQAAELDKMVGAAAEIQRIVGANWVWSDLLNLNTPDAAKIAEFWRDFRALDNIERHELFGAAITQAEQAAWHKTTVTPWSSKQQLEDAIQTRKTILQRALDRKTTMASMTPEQRIAYAREQGLKGYQAEGAPAAPAVAPGGVPPVAPPVAPVPAPRKGEPTKADAAGVGTTTPAQIDAEIAKAKADMAKVPDEASRQALQAHIDELTRQKTKYFGSSGGTKTIKFGDLK